MSSPPRAEGYDTPAQQREDSTTFMVAKVGLRCLLIAGASCIRHSSRAGPVHQS